MSDGHLLDLQGLGKFLENKVLYFNYCGIQTKFALLKLTADKFDCEKNFLSFKIILLQFRL